MCDTRHRPSSSAATISYGSPAVASPGSSSEGADDLADMDVHCLSRMVLQSLQFSELSSDVEAAAASVTFGGSATLGSPSASHNQ
jgi:hypothetical protein